MKGRVKFVIGKIEAPDTNMVIENIQVEVESEYSLGEVKGLIEIAKQLPDTMLEIFKKVVECEKEVDKIDEQDKRRWSKENVASAITEVVKGATVKKGATDISREFAK